MLALHKIFNDTVCGVPSVWAGDNPGSWLVS